MRRQEFCVQESELFCLILLTSSTRKASHKSQTPQVNQGNSSVYWKHLHRILCNNQVKQDQI